MKLGSLPFHIGAIERPSNPPGLPNTYPFEVVFDTSGGTLVQPANLGLEKLLQNAYGIGQAFGTPLSEHDFGRPYAEDFLAFIKEICPNVADCLEIGAGSGYLTRRLLDLGWEMTSIEPGQGFSSCWDKYGVEIIPEYFPSPRASGPYQLICSYGVLEHVPDSHSFLRNVKKHLAPSGVAIFAVPDCTDEILAGDPAILTHEHLSYFEAGSLARLFDSVDLKVSVVKSGFGRCLYIVASEDKLLDAPDSIVGLEVSIVESYPERCKDFIERFRQHLSDMNSAGSIGIYCAARGLASLDPAYSMRFFDDDPALNGKYFPPFPNAIERREDLLKRPVDHLVIMSRTFGNIIHTKLRQAGYLGKIMTLNDIL